MKLTKNEQIERRLSSVPISHWNVTDEKGQEILDYLRNTITEPEVKSEHSLQKEYWVKYYLENHANAYGLKVVGNLDTEVRGRRGDYRVRYDGRNMVLEVEKDLKYFFKHGHETAGAIGWTSPGSIDIVFAATDEGGMAEQLEIPVIIAADYTQSELGSPTFEMWYNRVREIKSAKEAFVFALFSSVHWEHTKGTPTIMSLGRDADEASQKYVRAIHGTIAAGVGRAVDAVLFSGDVAVEPDKDFVDLKAEAVATVASLYEEPAERECPRCSTQLTKLGNHRWVGEPDPQAMTEGQYADQYAAKLGGFFEEGVHGEILTTIYCFECRLGGAKGRFDLDPILFDNQSAVES